MVLDLGRISSDLELESRLACIDPLDRVHATDRIESIDTIHRHSGSVEQRSKPIACKLHVELHCCSNLLVDTISIIDDLVWISVIDIDQDDLDLEQWRRITERLSIRISCIRLMVLDLVRVSSDLELESRLTFIDHLDRVHATDRIESIDTIRRHSRSVDQRSKPIERELHAELHCSSINDIDTISIIDDLVWISVIDIDQDDLDLEQWNWITERLSIRIICIRLMVLDLVRISSDLELEQRITIIDDLDRVHTTDRIESIDTIHRHSRSVDQRSKPIACKLHVELHCCSNLLVDTISIIDDLVWISVIDIDQDDLELEQWSRITERVSIRIALDGIMVLDLVRIASDLELEPRITIDHLDRVHTTDRIESIDTIHRHSRSVDQRSCSIACKLHVELHCCSIVLVDASSIGDHIVQHQASNCHNSDDLDLEQWISYIERHAISIALDGIMVLDLIRIASDLELEPRITTIDHLDRVRSSSDGDWLVVGYIATHNQRSDSIERELLARVLGSAIADILIAESKHHRLWKCDIDSSSDDHGVEWRHRNAASCAIVELHSRLVVQCAIGSSDIGTHVRSRICEHLDQVHSSDRCTTIVHRLAGAVDQRRISSISDVHADVLVCVEIHIDAECVIDHHVQQRADIQIQRTRCEEPRSRNIEHRASRLVPHELMVLADAGSASDHRTDERRDVPDDMGGVHTTARSVGGILGHSAAEHQRSDTSNGQLLAPVHSCTIDELDTDRRSNDRVQCDHKLGRQHDSSEQHGTRIVERVSIRIALDGIMVLDLVRISSDLELGEQLSIVDRDRVHTTNRIAIDSAVH